MQLVDVHCHLESGYFTDNLPNIIRQATKAGIVKLITASISPSQWAKTLNIAAQFKEVECALGVHPWYIKPQDMDSLLSLATLCQNAVAIGEIGLDSKNIETTLEEQKPFFEAQLAIANELGLPVIMHCRGAFQELISSIKRVGVPKAGGIIHSFNGSSEIAVEFMKLGISFSLGGILTYRNSSKRVKLLKTIYPSHFLLETDSPDIVPIEARTDPPTPNVPSNILYNLHAAAELLGEPVEKVAETTTTNAYRIFDL